MLDISISYIMLTFIARDNIQRRDFWQLDFEIRKEKATNERGGSQWAVGHALGIFGAV